MSINADSLIPLMIKKVSHLQHVFSDDVLKAGAEIDKLLNWLLSDRSLQAHRACQAFMTYLYSVSEGFKSRDGFVTWIKCNCKFAEINITRANIEGKDIEFQKYVPHSLSFGTCSQKSHNEFFDELKKFAMRKYKVNFDDWFNHWSANENTM